MEMTPEKPQQPKTSTQRPQLGTIPRQAISDHLFDLLYILAGGHDGLPSQEQDRLREGIRVYAVDRREDRDVTEVSGMPGQPSLEDIAARAKDLPAKMDEFFLRYGVVWSDRKYIFHPGQFAVWQIQPEDINSSRYYSASPHLYASQLVTNLIKMYRFFSARPAWRTTPTRK